MKLLSLLMLLVVAASAQIFPEPACYKPIQRGPYTFECLFIEVPKFIPSTPNQLMVIARRDPSSAPEGFEVTAVLEKNGVITTSTSRSGVVTIEKSGTAIAIIYLPVGAYKLLHLAVERIEHIADLARVSMSISHVPEFR